MTILWAKVANFGTKILTKPNLFFQFFFYKITGVQTVLQKGSQPQLNFFSSLRKKIEILDTPILAPKQPQTIDNSPFDNRMLCSTPKNLEKK